MIFCYIFAHAIEGNLSCNVQKNAEIAQLVEHNLAKVGVASSSLVFRSKSDSCACDCLFLCQEFDNPHICGNSSVGRAQPCPKRINTSTLAREAKSRVYAKHIMRK